MKKKVVSCLLAAAMVVSSGAVVPGFFFMPEKVQAEENDTKSGKRKSCVKKVQLRQAKQRLIPHRRLRRLMEIKGTHWGTSQNKVTNEWIEVTLEKPTKVSEIKVFWERTGAAGNHQNNIKQWKLM